MGKPGTIRTIALDKGMVFTTTSQTKIQAVIQKCVGHVILKGIQKPNAGPSQKIKIKAPLGYLKKLKANEISAMTIKLY